MSAPASYGGPVSTSGERRWLSWWGGAPRSLVFDLAVALATITGELYSHGSRLPNPAGPAAVELSAIFLALALRRRFPLAALAVAVAVSAFVPAVGFAAAAIRMIALYTWTARWGSRLPTWVAAGAVAAAQIGASQADGELMTPGRLAFTLVSTVLPPLLAGLWVVQRQRLLAGYRERADRAERERELLAERAITDERRGIAREMHDVVAHRVGIVSLQAGALTVNAGDEKSGEIAETIRETSATALSELRTMLRVLRDEEDGTGPAPALDGIPALVDDATRSGASIELTMPDPVPEISSAVGRAAYRVVQEALTNAAKHAPHAAVHVEVAADEDELAVAVENRRSSAAKPNAVPGSGYGIVGMRERVALIGGRVRTGPTEDGGYRVHAVFPRRCDEESA